DLLSVGSVEEFVLNEQVPAVGGGPHVVHVEPGGPYAVDRVQGRWVYAVGQGFLIVYDDPTTPVGQEHKVTDHGDVVDEDAAAAIWALVAARLLDVAEVSYVKHHHLVTRAGLARHCQPGVVGVGVRVRRDEVLVYGTPVGAL